MKNIPRHLLALVGAFVILLAFGLWHLTTSPKMWFDDGIASNVAKNLAQFGTYGIQTAPGVFAKDLYWVTIHHPVTLPVALFFKLFGATILVMRLVMVGYLALTVLAAYLLVKELSDRYIATWSTWLLVTFAPFYGNGKAMLGETPGVCWLLIGSWCWLKALRNPNKKHLWLIAAGASFGLSAITKPYYLLILPALLLTKAIDIIRTRRLDLIEEFSFGLPLVTIVGAWLAHITPKPLSLANVLLVGRFFSNSYGEVITLEHMLRNALRFLTESTPLHLTLLLAIIAYFALQKKRELLKTPSPLIALTIFVLGSLAWYLKTPGWYRYFYSIHLIVLVLAPIALFAINLSRLNMNWRKGALIALIGVQTIITIQNADRFRSDAIFALANAASTLIPKDSPVFLAHVPEAAFVLPSDHLSQAIYINPTLSIGENNVLLSPTHLPPFVITALPGDVGVNAIEPVLQKEYETLWSKGHYRILKKR